MCNKRAISVLPQFLAVFCGIIRFLDTKLVNAKLMILDAQIFEFDITPESGDVGQRLDKVITEHLASLSRVKIQLLIKEGHVSVDGKPATSSYHMEAGEAARVHVTDDVLAPDWSTATPAHTLPLTAL